MFLNSNQIRAARGLIGWTVAELAQKVGVGTTTISAIETGRSAGSVEILNAIIYVFQNAGIEFTEDGGVRPIQSKISTYKNHDGFKAFFDDVYEVAKTHTNPDICVTSADESVFLRWLKSYAPVHQKRMILLKPDKLKVLLHEDDVLTVCSEYCEYRWIPKTQFANVSFYIYGDKAAFINFLENEAIITCVNNKDIARSLRKLFAVSWDNAYLKAKLNTL